MPVNDSVMLPESTNHAFFRSITELQQGSLAFVPAREISLTTGSSRSRIIALLTTAPAASSYEPLE